MRENAGPKMLQFLILLSHCGASTCTKIMRVPLNWVYFYAYSWGRENKVGKAHRAFRVRYPVRTTFYLLLFLIQEKILQFLILLSRCDASTCTKIMRVPLNWVYFYAYSWGRENKVGKAQWASRVWKLVRTTSHLWYKRKCFSSLYCSATVALIHVQR